MDRPRRVVQCLLTVATVVAMTAGGLGTTSFGAEDSLVLDVRFGTHGTRTRVVLDLTEQPAFDLRSEAEPERLVLDLEATGWGADPGPAPGRGLVAGYYVSDDRVIGSERLVLDLVQPVAVEDIFFISATGDLPYRFVIDLQPADPVPDMRSPSEAGTRQPTEQQRGLNRSPARPSGLESGSGAPSSPWAIEGNADPGDPLGPGSAASVAALAAASAPPLPARRPRPSLLPVVVLDAGHGGIDPGAVGASGVFEKDVTLEVTFRLRDWLMATGRFRVVLTRESDIYLRLRERVRLAREAGADVFLSLHADSNPDPDLHGVSVYTLSDRASDREAAQLAQQENRVDALAGVDIDPEDDLMASILIDLSQRRTRIESHVMAELLVDSLGRRATLLNNSHRQAGFAVLTAPDVPSVLVELGHLSNPEDERLLVTAVHQQMLVEALAEAIVSYFSRATARRGL